MRIGIDARMYGPTVGGGGLGRYVEQLVHELQTLDRANRYLLFLKKENLDACPAPTGFEKRLADIPWYSLREQLALAPLIDRENLDLVHFPHWNVPLRLKTPFVVTIHDLILLEEPRSARTTTRHPLVHAVKHAGFKQVLRHALNASQQIIAVSEYTKASILRFFPNVPEQKIRVVYEGVTKLDQGDTCIAHGFSLGVPTDLGTTSGAARPHAS